MSAVTVNSNHVVRHPAMQCGGSWPAGVMSPNPSLSKWSSEVGIDSVSAIGGTRTGHVLEIHAARNKLITLRNTRKNNLDGSPSQRKSGADSLRQVVKSSSRSHCSHMFLCNAYTRETIAADQRSIASEEEIFQNGKVGFSRSAQAPLSMNFEQAIARETGAVVAKLEATSKSEEDTGIPDRQDFGSNNGYGSSLTSTLVLDRKPITGGAFDFRAATTPLSLRPLVATKKIVLVRHGLSTWNAESRIQGSTDMSVLSDEGVEQAERCKRSLAKLKFSACFASPISRAKTSAEVIWNGREEPLVFLDSLKEAHLLFLEGMRNVDAREQHPELFQTWREDPSNFQVDGVYPILKLWDQAKVAWQEILSAEGDMVLVVTHKSILRALLCTALGMGPDRFRAMDVNNGGVSIVSVNTKGQPLLECLNMTAHMHVDGVLY